MYFNGIILGIASFLSIGVFHPIVIWCEYHFSYRIWLFQQKKRVEKGWFPANPRHHKARSSK